MLEGLRKILVEYPQSVNRAGIALISEVAKCVQHWRLRLLNVKELAAKHTLRASERQQFYAAFFTGLNFKIFP
jgi:hypothetical protein